MLPVLIAALIGQKLMGGHTDLSAVEAADIYVKLRHPHHYLLASLDSLSARPWMVHAAIIVALPLGCALALSLTGNPRRSRMLLLAGVAFAAIPAVHWLLVEGWPTIAGIGLGLTRAYLFGWWCAAFSVAMMAGLAAQALTRQLRVRIRSGAVHGAWGWHVGVFCCGCALMLAVAGSLRDPRPTVRREHGELLTWLATLPATAVVSAPPGDLPVYIQLLAQRPVFCSPIFTFGLEAWHAYGDRWRAVRGGIGEVPSAHYSALTVEQILTIGARWPLDVWITTREAVLPGYAPDFSDGTLIGYRMTTLARQEGAAAAQGVRASPNTAATGTEPASHYPASPP